MPRFRIYTSTAIVLLFIFSSTSYAGKKLHNTVALATKLNELKMFDYSEYLLKREIAKSPREVERLRIALAETYILTNKSKKGEDIISKIPPSSPFFPHAQYILGINTFQKRNFKIGIQALKKFTDYYTAVFTKTPPKQKRDRVLIEQFNKAVQYLNYAYKKQGDATAASKVLELLRLTKPKGTADAHNREIALYQQTSRIDAAEKLKELEEKNPEELARMKRLRKDRLNAAKRKIKIAKKKGKHLKLNDLMEKYDDDWETILTSAIAKLEDLQWMDPDSITALSYVQIGRAYYLLERYKEAMKKLDTLPALVKACDKEFAKSDQLSQAPGAGIRFWKGKIFMTLGDQATRQKKVKLYSKALKKFLAILVKYKGYHRSEEAYTALFKAKDELETLGKTVKLPEIDKPAGAHVSSLISEKATQLFKNKKFAQAVPLLLKTIVNNRSDAGIVDGLYMLVMCYARLPKHDLEALSVSMYMANLFPKSKHTHMALLQAGELFWNASKQASDSKVKEVQTENALTLYELFLKTNPGHQYAGEIATRIAKEFYDKAIATGKTANKLSGEAKATKAEEAKEQFKIAIPKYRRIIENYGNRHKFVNMAHYVLAICYASSGQYKASSEAYLTFCEKEKENQQRLVNAKLGAADSYFKGAQEIENKVKKLKETAYKLPGAQADDTKGGAKETMLAKAADLESKAKEYFKLAIVELKDLIHNWFSPTGRLGRPSDKATKSTAASAQQLLAWSYDAIDEKSLACKEFQIFINKYPKSDKIPACMMRMGVIFTELNDDTKAEKILAKLVSKYPDSQEGKNATFFLGKSLFKNEKYAKSVKEFKKIFANKQDISTQNLRWIAQHLSECTDKNYIKESSLLALQAGEILMGKLQKPVMSEWVGKQKATTLANNPKALKNTLNMLTQKVEFNIATAAYQGQQYDKAVKSLSSILNDDRTPYFYEAKLARSNAYKELKMYDDARNDLGDIALHALTSGNNALDAQAKYYIGETYFDEDNYTKALASFYLLASTRLNTDKELEDLNTINMTDVEKKKYMQNQQDEKEWIELAAYRGACCASLLGEKKEKEKKYLVALYKKEFPEGKFIKQIDDLPKP